MVELKKTRVVAGQYDVDGKATGNAGMYESKVAGRSISYTVRATTALPKNETKLIRGSTASNPKK